jgi:hypothetical protein
MQDLFIKTISQYVENQFPALYREEGEMLVEFVKAYYEYLENERMLNREMFTIKDIDTTFEEFLVWFKRKYIEGFPFVFATDERFLIKNIIDYYRAKGSEQSLKLLIKFLFNEDVEVYYPKVDILKPSASEWKVPEYIELSFSNRTKSFVNKIVTGSESKAEAFVEGVVTKRVDGKLIDLLYITEIRGDFLTGDFISDDGNLVNSPKMIGSLTSISVFEQNNTGGYSIGDRLRVVSPGGIGAFARIKRLLSSSDKVDVRLVDGGYGFTLDNKTDVMMSDAVIFCNNLDNRFEDLETITQRIVRIEVNSPVAYEIGSDVFGFHTNSVYLGRGILLSSDIDEDLNTQIMTVEIREGVFNTITTIELQNQNFFIEGETIEEESIVILTVDDAAGFQVGETITQREIVGAAGFETGITIGIGIVDSVGINTIRVISAFGRFEENLDIIGINSAAISEVLSVEYEFQGTTARIVEINNTEITTILDGEDFQIGSKIRGKTTKVTNFVNAFDNIKWNFVAIDSGFDEVLSLDDMTASGIVIGQNERNIGVFGNTHPYIFVEGAENFIVGSKSGIQKEITRVGEGQNAAFILTELTDIEEVVFTEDLIGGSNIMGVQYLNITLDGKDSFVGRVAEVKLSQNSPTGTGYANGTPISFTGGGYSNQDPAIQATGYIETDEFGSIADIILSTSGEGYLTPPLVTISGGSGDVQLEAELNLGYGFPKNPYGGRFSVINDVLTNTISNIGTIAAIRFTNPGFNYDTNPFARVINNSVKKRNYNNFYIYYSINQRMFSVGEIIISENGARGRILEITAERIKVKNLSFNAQFRVGNFFSGLTSQTGSIIDNIEFIPNTTIGDNAVISTVVVLSSGIVAEVEIIDSGIGYVNGSAANLIDTDGNVATRGILSLGKSGRGAGFWLTNTSHLNEKKLHDNYYYQEYSYEVIVNNSFDRYEEILRNLLHVSGTELFGRTQKETEGRINVRSASRRSSGRATFTSAELVGDSNIGGVPYMDIMINGSLESGIGRIAVFPGSIRIIDGGTGYTNNSTITFIGGGLNGGEPEKSAKGFITTTGGVITGIVITDQGEGYWELPQIQFAGGDGNAVVEIDIEYGYGFPRRPYNNYFDLVYRTLTASPYKYEEIDNTVIEEA